MKTLTVLSSNITSNNSFCNKLQSKTNITIPTPFGNNVSEHQETYYLFTDKQNPVGMSAPLDISLFDIVEKPFKITNDDGTMETVQLKYLYPKK